MGYSGGNFFAAGRSIRWPMASSTIYGRDPKSPTATPIGPDPISELPPLTFTGSRIVDGADHTLMFSENLINPHYMGPPDPTADRQRTRTRRRRRDVPCPYLDGDRHARPRNASWSKRVATFYQQLEPMSGQGNVFLNPTVSTQQTVVNSPCSIQEWLIGMVWMLQPNGPTPNEWVDRLVAYQSLEHQYHSRNPRRRRNRIAGGASRNQTISRCISIRGRRVTITRA